MPSAQHAPRASEQHRARGVGAMSATGFRRISYAAAAIIAAFLRPRLPCDDTRTLSAAQPRAIPWLFCLRPSHWAPGSACAIPRRRTSRASCWPRSTWSSPAIGWCRIAAASSTPRSRRCSCGCRRRAHDRCATGGSRSCCRRCWRHWATLWLTWDLARRDCGRGASRHTPPRALCVCLQFGLQAKRGQIDMVLVALTTLSLWGLLRHLLRGPDWRAAWLGAFAAGVGTVTKGVGFLPLLVLLPWLLVRRVSCVRSRARQRTRDHAAMHGVGCWSRSRSSPAPRCGSGRCWSALAARRRSRAARLRQRAAVQARPASATPMRGTTCSRPGTTCRSSRRCGCPARCCCRGCCPAWWRRLRRGDRALMLLLGWSALVLLFFSASPGKREVYMFPMLPAMCLAAAPLLPALLRRRGVRRRCWLCCACFRRRRRSLVAVGAVGPDDWAQRLAAASRDRCPHRCARCSWWMLALGMARARDWPRGRACDASHGAGAVHRRAVDDLWHRSGAGAGCAAVPRAH